MWAPQLQGAPRKVLRVTAGLPWRLHGDSGSCGSPGAMAHMLPRTPGLGPQFPGLRDWSVSAVAQEEECWGPRQTLRSQGPLGAAAPGQ